MNTKQLIFVGLLGAILIASAFFAQTAFSKPTLPQTNASVEQAEGANVGEPGWRTPPMSQHYPPFIPTPGWHTPQTSNYKPNSPAGEPGWRTPPMSQHYPPFIPTPGWRTPPTSNYTQ